MMTGKQKLYFLLEHIVDARDITPAGQPLIIDPTNDLNRKYSDNELTQLFTKLEKDEKVIKVLQIPSRLQMIEIIDDPFEYQPEPESNDGCFHIELLPAFDDYLLRIQDEQGYQEFTGKIPSRHKIPLEQGLSALKPQEHTKSPKSNENTPKDIKDQTVSRDVDKTEEKFNTNLWVKNLEAICQQALTAKPTKPFFLAIYDYVNYVLETDTLAQLSDVFYVHKKTDYETADQYKKELIEYIETLIPKLEKYQTDDPAEKDDIKEILSIKKGTTQVMGDPEGWLSIFGHIESMSWDAFRNDKVNKSILDLLGVEDNDGKKTTKWKALEIEEKYKYELDKLERLKETRGWYAWEHLRLFYEMFNDYESIRLDLASKKRWFEGMNFSYLIQELKAILKNTTYDQMQVFTYDNYITYLNKAHRQLINEIAQFEAISKAEQPQITTKQVTSHIPFTFDDENATLTIKDKQIKFKKDTRKLALLKLLMKKPKGIYHAEVVKELEGADVDGNEAKGMQNIYYEACRSIEMSFVKVGITDFLNYDYSQAKINPIYKRAS